MAYNSLTNRTDVGPLIPEQVSGAMLNNLSAQSAAIGMGTRIPVSRNQVRFPILTALPVAYWVSGDTGLKQSTEMAWDNKYLNIEELAAFVPVPDNVMEDADFDIWEQVRPPLEGAIARAIDAAVFFGTSAPASFPDEIVTAAVAAGNTVTTGTAATAAGGIFGDLSALLGLLEADGYVADSAIANITVRKMLRDARATTGDALDLGRRLEADLPDFSFPAPGLWPSGSGATQVIMGDSSRLVIGVRSDFTYKMVTEGVVTDNSGAVVYNSWQQDMSILRVTFRMGWEVSNPINYQQPTLGSRYPFGVLRAA